MSEPLDLEPIRERDRNVAGRMRPPAPPEDWMSKPSARIYNIHRERAWFDAEHDRRALLAEVHRLRDEITDRANVEADLRAQLAEAWEKGHTVGSRRHTLTVPGPP